MLSNSPGGFSQSPSGFSRSPGGFSQSPSGFSLSIQSPPRGRGDHDLTLPSWLFGLEEEDYEEKVSTAAAEVNVKLESERRYDDREKESGEFNVCQVWKP